MKYLLSDYNSHSIFIIIILLDKKSFTNLKTDNNRYLNVEGLGRIDDTLGDDVTPHDTAEDVHHDCRHFRVG